MLNTQREDWLLPTEPMHGARLRQTGRERPPVIDNPTLKDAKCRTFLLSPGQRILRDEEVFTPPRGGGGGRPVPEPQGVPHEVRDVPKPFPDGFQKDKLRDGGQNFGSPVDMLVDTEARMQKDLAMLREENLVLRTPATSQVIQAPRRAALTTTKVPRFDGTTSWEQYNQVFEAIVRSNGWDNDIAALQLFSHLEGDALNVAHLVPLARQLSRSGLVDALTAHYGSPGRLATALETLAVNAFGDMGQTAGLRLIRDRFIAGHSNCDLRRRLDSVSPETPIRDVVDRCCVWESHADPAVRQIGKPTPDPINPTYVVSNTDSENTRVAAVSGLKSDQNLAPACDFDRGASGSKSGDARHGKTVTTAGEGGTESANHGCKTTSADDGGTDCKDPYT